MKFWSEGVCVCVGGGGGVGGGNSLTAPYIIHVLLSYSPPKNGEREPVEFESQHVHIITPFAIHYEKICIHFREMGTSSAKIHSLAARNGYLRASQIQ